MRKPKPNVFVYYGLKKINRITKLKLTSFYLKARLLLLDYWSTISAQRLNFKFLIRHNINFLHMNDLLLMPGIFGSIGDSIAMECNVSDARVNSKKIWRKRVATVTRLNLSLNAAFDW